MAATVTAIASTLTSTTLLDGSSRGSSIYNTDANALYVLLADGTASATNFSVKLYTDDFYEVPTGYKGKITGVWAGDGSGSAYVTEY